MKFILSLSLLVIILSITCIYSSSSSSSSSNDSSFSSDAPSTTYNYIKTNMFTNSETCQGEPDSVAFLLLNICGFEGISRVICLEDGTIENIIYSENGCTGDILQRIHVEPNNCTNAETYECVESLSVPSNSYQVWYTHSACENDPNWKEDVWQMAYTLTDTCLYSSAGAGMIQCNSTLAIENIYNSTTTCNPSDNTGYKYLTLPECSKKSSMFAMCGNQEDKELLY